MSELFRVEGLSVDIREGHLWKRTSKRIVNHVGFTVREGEATAYLGPNGAGKTTTFRAICGLSSMAEGKIFWKGEEISTNTLHRHIGFLPEHPYFYHSLTPRELLTGLGRLSGIHSMELEKQVARWADRLRFTKILDQMIRTCSKGQMQRVGLAQALLHNPELLILDEPMSGLDPIGRAMVADVLMEANQNGTTMLFSSHILSDAENLCSNVVAINEGAIIFNGSLAALIENGGGWELLYRKEGKLPWAEGIHCNQVDVNVTRAIGFNETMTLQQAVKHCISNDADIVSATPLRQRLEEAFINLIRHSNA